MDELVDELSKRGRMSQAEARETIEETYGPLARRGLALQLRDLHRPKELGLVTRREWEDVELRLAQLEHRLRIVEGGKPPSGD